jgi:hypothetical protein
MKRMWRENPERRGEKMKREERRKMDMITLAC